MAAQKHIKKVMSALVLGVLSSLLAHPVHAQQAQRPSWLPQYDRTVEVIEPQLICQDAHMRTQFSIFIHHKGKANIDAIEADSVRRAIAWGRAYFGQNAQFYASIDAYADANMSGAQGALLSDQRAYAVSRLLMSQSIGASDISIASYGKYNPKYRPNSVLAGATHVKVHVISAADVQKCAQQFPGRPMYLPR